VKLKNNKNFILLHISDHLLKELIKIDEGKNITLEKRILIILGSYVNKIKERKAIDE